MAMFYMTTIRVKTDYELPPLQSIHAVFESSKTIQVHSHSIVFQVGLDVDIMNFKRSLEQIRRNDVHELWRKSNPT